MNNVFKPKKGTGARTTVPALSVRAVAILTAVLLANTAARPQTGVDPRVGVGFESIQAARLRGDLTFLASEPLAGRMSLERGSDVAIQYIASEFAKSGLKPLAGDSYLQPITLIEYHADTKATHLTLTRSGTGTHYHRLTDFFSSFPYDVTVKAPVVFAGYGITAPEFSYDDYAGIDARGKIVLVFDHEPQETDPRSIFNGLGNTRHANSRLKILNAQKHGAVGILVASEPNRKHGALLDMLLHNPVILDRLTRFPSQAIADDEARIPLAIVNDALAANLLATCGRTASQLQSSIDATLKPASVALPDTQIEMQLVNTDSRRAVTANVVGLVEGSDPALKAETIVFSGHYDHDGVFDGKMYPGADDNGSGTVGVIELARAFAMNPAKPKRSILFAVFAAEERGLLGSYYYAQHPLRPLSNTRAVINFDMIGRNEARSAQTEGLIKIADDTSNELNLIGTINSPDYRSAVERENRSTGLLLNYKWDEDSALNVFQRSDQFPFSLFDIPAVWWFTGFHPDYHQPTDTVERINFVKMEKILRLAYLTGWSFADASTNPRFVANPRAEGR
jgi:hypothetical protein